MGIETQQLAVEISLLFSRLDERGDIPQDEIEVARHLNALPVGADFAYFLLNQDCVVISYDPPHEPEFIKDSQSLLHALVHASRRFPTLSRFVPPRPVDASDCLFCSGTGMRGTYVGTNTPARCFCCAGLGWDTSAA